MTGLRILPALLLVGVIATDACTLGLGKTTPIGPWQPHENVSRLSLSYDGFEGELLVQLPNSFDRTCSYPLVL